MCHEIEVHLEPEQVFRWGGGDLLVGHKRFGFIKAAGKVTLTAYYVNGLYEVAPHPLGVSVSADVVEQDLFITILTGQDSYQTTGRIRAGCHFCLGPGDVFIYGLDKQEGVATLPVLAQPANITFISPDNISPNKSDASAVSLIIPAPGILDQLKGFRCEDPEAYSTLYKLLLAE